MQRCNLQRHSSNTAGFKISSTKTEGIAFASSMKQRTIYQFKWPPFYQRATLALEEYGIEISISTITNEQTSKKDMYVIIYSNIKNEWSYKWGK